MAAHQASCQTIPKRRSAVKTIIKTFEDENDDFHVGFWDTGTRIAYRDVDIAQELKKLLAGHKKPRPSAESAQNFRWIVQTFIEQLIARLEHDAWRHEGVSND
jgi:hypothetical protein